MTIREAFELAGEKPTPIAIQTVITRLGGFGPCARLLLMGDNGRRAVRSWYYGSTPIPTLCWAVLVAYDRQESPEC